MRNIDDIFVRPSQSVISASAPVQPQNFQLLRSHADWRRTWTHIVAGKFSRSPYSGLLFYEQSSGFAEFYETDGAGGIALLHQHTDWRGSWTQVVAGSFGGTGFSGLLLYDQQAGFGAFYDTDGQGNLIKLAEYDGWRTTWTHIIAGRFIESESSSLLFYDQSAGFGAIYATNYDATDGALSMTLLAEYDDWRTGWTHILPGEFWPHDPVITDLFFYEGSSRYGETYASAGDGGITLFGSHPNLPAATTIIPGVFGGWGWTNLLFYDAQSGHGTFQDLDGSTARWSSIEDHNEWRRTWDIIVPGNFWMADEEDRHFADGGFTDLLFYDRGNGYGEFYLHEPLNPTFVEPFAGYVSSGSVCPGDTITFHVSSQVGQYTINIFRQGVSEVLMANISELQAAPSPLPISRTAYRDGAQWPAVASFTIPESWPSGLYLARVEAPSIVADPGGNISLARIAAPGYKRLVGIGPSVPPLDIPFVVRAAVPGNQARILLAVSDTTYEAYNYWGGRSLYGYGHGGMHTWAYPAWQTAPRVPYAFRVSFKRPHTALGIQSKKWQYCEVPFIRWLERQAIRVEVCAASDLHKQSDLLSHYRLLVNVGHSEYWSKEMRDNVEGFVASGGNVAFFAGNVCWWQVRFEDDGNTMVCYKNKDFDPDYPARPDTVTVNWYDDPVKRPETSLTGVSWLDPRELPDRAEYTVLDADHWVFANTGLHDGNAFGLYDQYSQTVVGTETDRYQETSPASFRKLASVRAPDGSEGATMGIFANGGTVFTAATINWALGLSQDDSWNPMDLITRNVLVRLG